MKFETSLKAVIPRTIDIASFRFPKPKGFNYKAGQYLICTIKANGNNIVHHFSFSSSPTEKEHIEFTKKLTDSEYSMALKRIKPGDWALIDAPYGRFTFEGEYPKICLLTGGIGITPFRSIIKYCTDSGISSDIVLFYGCHSPKEMAFKNEFEEMMIKNKNLRVVFTVSEPNIDWKGYVGNITLDMLKKEAPDYEDRIFYACGPPGMITAMKKLIQRLGIAETRLNLESFLGYG